MTTEITRQQMVDWLDDVASAADGSEYGDAVLNAIRAALTEQQSGCWLSMDSAPKDGTPILALVLGVTKQAAREADYQRMGIRVSPLKVTVSQ